MGADAGSGGGGKRTGGGGRGTTALLVAAIVVAVGIEAVRAPEVHIDLAPLYAAAVLFDQGRVAEAYDLDPSDARYGGAALTGAARARGYPVKRVLRYLHPPAVAAALVPLTLLDFPEAALAFRLASLLALAVAAALLGRLAGGGAGRAAFALLAMLLADPVRMTLDLGQTNALVLLLVAAGVLARFEVLAGAAVGLAGVLKTYVLAVPVVMLAAGRWKGAVAAAVALAAVHGAALAVSPDGTGAYADMARDLSGMQFLWPDQQSAAAQVSRVETGFEEADLASWRDSAVPAGTGGPVAVGWAVVVLGGAALLAWRRKPDLPAAGALGIVSGMLASPVLHTHYPVLLAVPAAWMAGRGRADAPAWILVAGLALAALPLHRGEAPFLLHYLSGTGVHWAFVTRTLAGVALAFAGVAWAVAAGGGGRGRASE